MTIAAKSEPCAVCITGVATEVTEPQRIFDRNTGLVIFTFPHVHFKCASCGETYTDDVQDFLNQEAFQLATQKHMTPPKFRFHLLGFPHTATNRDYCACAYTNKLVKFIDMMAPRGHEIIHYGNEGSYVKNDSREPVGRLCEHIQTLTEAERASWFGPHDRQKLYDLKWDGREPYWQLFNDRAIAALKQRVQPGDFILTLAGANCHQAIGDAFPGSYGGVAQTAMMVEFGIGYYGTFSRYCVYESNSHREWIHGRRDSKGENNDDAVISNYFSLDDFAIDRAVENRVIKKIDYSPFYLFIGRLVDSKGLSIADEVLQHCKTKRLVVAGQGELKISSKDVVHFGHATIEERAVLMSRAIAVFAPSRYREPFGGVAVEAQLCGTPAITTDHGAFTETVSREWRCASQREFVEAAEKAAKLTSKQRNAIKAAAQARFSLEAIAPQYEQYFQRLQDRWGAGWYQDAPVRFENGVRIADGDK